MVKLSQEEKELLAEVNAIKKTFGAPATRSGSQWNLYAMAKWKVVALYLVAG
jgi:hypothetical protein